MNSLNLSIIVYCWRHMFLHSDVIDSIVGSPFCLYIFSWLAYSWSRVGFNWRFHNLSWGLAFHCSEEHRGEVERTIIDQIRNGRGRSGCGHSSIDLPTSCLFREAFIQSNPLISVDDRKKRKKLLYIKVHTATKWTIRHGLMLLWFIDLMSVIEEITIDRPKVSTLLSSAFMSSA